jgi:hypothetical protein
VFTPVGELGDVIELLGDERDPERITGEEGGCGELTRGEPDVELLTGSS